MRIHQQALEDCYSSEIRVKMTDHIVLSKTDFDNLRREFNEIRATNVQLIEENVKLKQAIEQINIKLRGLSALYKKQNKAIADLQSKFENNGKIVDIKDEETGRDLNVISQLSADCQEEDFVFVNVNGHEESQLDEEVVKEEIKSDEDSLSTEEPDIRGNAEEVERNTGEKSDNQGEGSSGIDASFTQSGENEFTKSTRGIEKLFVCDHCGKSYSQKQAVKVHMRVHTGEKPFDCNVCGRKFRQRHHLNIHLTTHTGERPYACDQCDLRFPCRSALNNHKAKLHPGDGRQKKEAPCQAYLDFDNVQTHIVQKKKSYDCTLCNEQFATKFERDEHKKTHLTEKLFVCELCGLQCSSKCSLIFHNLRIHAVDKSFSCAKCTRRFSCKSDLRNHMVTHKNEKMHACDQCQKRFNHKTGLRAHKLKHSGEKPFVCDFDTCTQKFAQKFKLNEHKKKVHLAVKPFACGECESTFSSLYNLNRHKSTVHKLTLNN